MPYVFGALTLIFAIVYAFIRRDGNLPGRLFYKTAASVMALLLAVSLRIHAEEPYFTLIVVGLCLSLAGDVLLLFTDRGSAFLAGGMVCFLLTHIAYIAAFFTRSALSFYDGAFFLLLAVFALAVFHGRKAPQRRSIIVGTIYGVVLCVMAARALSMPFTAGHDPIFVFAPALGGVLFYASDILLALESFKTPHARLIGAMSTLAYYSGQLFIAMSCIVSL